MLLQRVRSSKLNKDIIQTAEAFLAARAVKFVKPGSLLQRTGDTFEVCFMIPEALDPNVVVDPPDIKVLVHLSDGHCELVPQM